MAGRREADGEAGLRVAGVRAGVVVAVPEALVALKVGVGAGGGCADCGGRRVPIMESSKRLEVQALRNSGKVGIVILTLSPLVF